MTVLEKREVTRAGRAQRSERLVAPDQPSTAVVVLRRPPRQPVVSRRRTLQASFWSGLAAILAGTVASDVDFLNPRSVSGSGGNVSVGESTLPPPGRTERIGSLL